MQPWKISAGLTAALAGSASLLAGSRLEYLAPFWPLILADHGLAIAVHLVLGLAAVAASIYAVARAAGLSDLGRRVDLAERSEETPRATGTDAKPIEGKRLLGPSAFGNSTPIRHPLGPRGPGSCRPTAIHSTTTHRFFCNIIERTRNLGQT